MSTQKFNHTWIKRLPYSSKRKVYIDSTNNTKFTNCDFVLIVGARSKTAYLRYRPTKNGVRKAVLKKIGDANVNLSDQEDTGLAASYTMGGMSVSAFTNKSDNVAGTAGREDEVTQVTLSFSF